MKFNSKIIICQMDIRHLIFVMYYWSCIREDLFASCQGIRAIKCCWYHRPRSHQLCVMNFVSEFVELFCAELCQLWFVRKYESYTFFKFEVKVIEIKMIITNLLKNIWLVVNWSELDMIRFSSKKIILNIDEIIYEINIIKYLWVHPISWSFVLLSR